MGRSTKRCALVRLPGYPFRPEAFMPAAELHLLAARLLAVGLDARIVDWGTPTLLERCYPAAWAPVVRSLAAGLLEGGGDPRWNAAERGVVSGSAGRAFLRRRRRTCQDLGDSLARGQKPGVVLFWLETADDVAAATIAARAFLEKHPDARVGASGPVLAQPGGGSKVRNGLLEPVPPVRAAQWLLGGRAPAPETFPNLTSLPALSEEALPYPTVSTCPPESVSCSVLCERLSAGALHVTHTAGPVQTPAWPEAWGSVPFSATLSPADMNAEAIARLRMAGCEAVRVLVPTGSQRLLDRVYDGQLGISETERVLRACKASGIAVSVALAYPCLEDDEHTMAETLRLLERTRPAGAAVRTPVAPGTPAGAGCFSRFPSLPVETVAVAGGTGPDAGWRRQSLTSELVRLGISPVVSAPLAVIGRALGCGSCLPAFARRVTRSLLEGDAAAVDALARQFRHATVGTPGTWSRGRPPAA